MRMPLGPDTTDHPEIPHPVLSKAKVQAPGNTFQVAQKWLTLETADDKWSEPGIKCGTKGVVRRGDNVGG